LPLSATIREPQLDATALTLRHMHPSWAPAARNALKSPFTVSQLDAHTEKVGHKQCIGKQRVTGTLFAYFQ
jgi:hypothetical protein